MKVLKPWKYDSVPLESTLGTDFENIHILVPEYNVICAGKGKNESVFKYEWGLRRKTLHHVLKDD